MIRRLVIFALVLLAVQAAVFQMKMSRHDGKGTKLLKEGKEVLIVRVKIKVQIKILNITKTLFYYSRQGPRIPRIP